MESQAYLPPKRESAFSIHRFYNYSATAQSIPKGEQKKCEGCGECVDYCAQEAISLIDEKAKIDRKKCVGINSARFIRTWTGKSS